jgi:hypothetical protein
MTREIVTLQIGHNANYVGAHLWNHLHIEQNNQNTQIDYNTYFNSHAKTNIGTPRVLIVDYRNTFGHLFDENPNHNVTNDSSIEIIQRTNDKQFWSNELNSQVKFHSKSLIPLNDYWYPVNDEENQFDIYPIGEQTFKTMFNSIEHGLHYQLESCDAIQSFRCLFDVTNSFSGLFTSVGDYLADECPKQPIWSFALGNRSTSLPINLSLALSHSLTNNRMPIISCLDQADPVRLALAIQHALFSPTLTLDLLADQMCPMKTNLLNLFWKLPWDLHETTLYNYLQDNDLLTLTNPLACHCFLRGIHQQQLCNTSLYKLSFSTSADLIDRYLREQYESNVFLSTHSWLETFSGKFVRQTFDNAALLSALTNDQDYSVKFIGQLRQDLKKINYKQLSKRWEENDFDEQTFDQLVNEINISYEQYASI